MENTYYHSEGYVYKGNDTICKLYGTDEEKEKQGIEICKLLNNKIKTKLFYFVLGLIFSLITMFLVNFSA